MGAYFGQRICFHFSPPLVCVPFFPLSLGLISTLTGPRWTIPPNRHANLGLVLALGPRLGDEFRMFSVLFGRRDTASRYRLGMNNNLQLPDRTSQEKKG